MVSFEELSTQFKGLVKSESRRYQGSLVNSGIDREDLEQEALIVLWEVSQKAESLEHAGRILKREIQCRMVDLNRSVHRKCRSNVHTSMSSEMGTSDLGTMDFWERYHQRQPSNALTELVAGELYGKIADRLTVDEKRTFDFLLSPDGELIQRAIGLRYKRRPRTLKRPIVARALGISVRDLKKHENRIRAIAKEVMN